MKRWTPWTIVDALILAAILLFVAAAVHGQTPTPAPKPKGPHVNGYWQVQPGIYVPCNAIKPFQPFVNTPGDGNTYYLGGDVNANIPHPNLYPQTIDAIYFNHTRAAYSAEGFITPLFPQLGPINFYPAPSTAAQLCTQYSGFGNTSQCPTTTDSAYTSKFLTNAVWTQSYAVYLPQIQADCSGPQPTNTPIRTATAVPTATPTPLDQYPGAFVDWIYEATKEGYFTGCAPNYFCPGNQAVDTAGGRVTRAQEAYFLLIGAHGLGYKPPACTPPGSFVDVPCGH